MLLFRLPKVEMSARDRFFEGLDSPHGLAKRIILHRYLQGEFARGFRKEWKAAYQTEYNEQEYGATYFVPAWFYQYSVNTERSQTPTYPSEDELKKQVYDMTYFDAFAGAGFYQNKNVEDVQYVKNENPTCPFEDERFGSPLVALHAFYQHVTEQRVNGAKKVLLVFVEKNESNFQQLKQNVKRFIDSKRGRNETFQKDTIIWDVTSCNGENVRAFIQFFHCSFKNFDETKLRSNKPMVSFIDPFGYSHTPMEKVIKYAGIRRSVILNFMVGSIHRFAKVDVNQSNFEELFSKQWRDYLPSDFDDMPVPEKMQNYSSIYQTLFKEAYQGNHRSRLAVHFIEFSMRRGSKVSVERGFIYYLLFAAVDLRSLANVKYACHCVAQNFRLPSTGGISSEQLYFCDYYFNAGTPWRPTAKTEDEAKSIYSRFKGTTEKFGKVKEWIILESPYYVKSAAFKYLEDYKYLQVVSFNYDREDGVPEYKRPRSGVFPNNVGIKHDDPDWDTRHDKTIRYCNGWELKFHEM